ncbi:MAG: radical SAM protein [Deltaproteobacteria bacterium]|nr:radical SAM protein [Deltaproteobacteria bacterium]
MNTDSGFACRGSDCMFCKVKEELQWQPKQRPDLKIRSIALNIIERCNMRCHYCFAGKGDYGFDSSMSMETAIRAVDFFTQDQDDLHIVFFGGEPLLRFRLIYDLVHWCIREKSDKRFTFALTTNGLLMDQEKLDFFVQHRFSLRWSWDGPLLQGRQRQLHGTKKQSSAASDVIGSKIRRLSKGLSELRSFCLRATLDHNSLSLAIENILNMICSTDFRVAWSRVSSSDSQLRFSGEDIEQYCHVFEGVVSALLKEKDYPSLLRIRSLQTYVRVFHSGSYHRNFCGAGLEYLSVSTRGRFYLCHRFTEDEEESLGSLEDGFDMKKIKAISRHRMMEDEPCQSCWMREICAGGCFHEHKMGTGHIMTIDPFFCQIQDTEMRQALRVYLEMTVHAPELLE